MGRTKSKKGRLTRLLEKIRTGIKSFQEYREREARAYEKARRKYRRTLEPYVEGFLNLFTFTSPQPPMEIGVEEGLGGFDVGDVGFDILGTPGMGGSIEFGGEVGMGRRRSRRKKRRGRKRRKRRR